MNQPDSNYSQTPVDNAYNQASPDSAKEAQGEVARYGREWLPEDDDDWYEPDYNKQEARGH